MKTDISNIAILFFSRTAKEEATAKKWLNAGDVQANEQLAQCLIDRSKSAIQKSGLPIFSFDSSKQVGNTFGERLANAFAQIFDKGYEAVISVGNDTPQLNEVHWPDVIGALQKGQSVLGPSQRGGAYLIGISRKRFRYNEFVQLPWKKSQLVEGLKTYLQQNGNTVKHLPKLRDINTWYDLKHLARETKENSILKLLKHWISIKNFTIISEAPHIKNYFLHYSGLRAPPTIDPYQYSMV